MWTKSFPIHTYAPHTHIFIEIQQFNSRANYSCGLSVQSRENYSSVHLQLEEGKLSMPTHPFSSSSRRSRAFCIWVVPEKWKCHCWSIIEEARNCPLFSNVGQRNRQWDGGEGQMDHFTDKQLQTEKIEMAYSYEIRGSKTRELQNLDLDLGLCHKVCIF